MDNGSADQTAEVARAAGATVVWEPRRGYGAACFAGVAALRERPPLVLVFMAADGSDDPRAMSELTDPIVQGRCDLVLGSRVERAEPGALTTVQRFGNAFATRLLALLFGARFRDLGPYRAIAWDAFHALDMRDRDFGWTVEMQARAAKLGLRWIEVPVRYRRRAAGRSKISGTVWGSLAAGFKILTTGWPAVSGCTDRAHPPRWLTLSAREHSPDAASRP